MLPLSEKDLDELVARERERGAPPLTNWDALAERLLAEGLMQPPSRFVLRPWMRMAAAIALVAGGAVAGRMTASAPVPQSAATPASPASTALASTQTQFRSAEDAWEALNRAGEEYQRASAYLSASNTEVPMPSGPDQYRTRLVALDNVMSDMRDALKEAPQDPVINQYYLATVGAREATLRQLGTTLPASARLNRF